MTRQYWKKQVRILLPSGKIIQEDRDFGDRLLRSGAAIEVKGAEAEVDGHPRYTIRLLKANKILETTP